MPMKINKTIKPATPWNVSIATLTSLEKTIASSEGEALKARWLFGRELVNRRVDYKGRLVIPRDLMALTIEKCGVSKIEVNRRVQFATRYPTKDLMSHAVRDYSTWHQMVREGLIEKKRVVAKKKEAKQSAHSGRWIIRRLQKEADKALSHHTTLTRAQVQDLEDLAATIQKILERVDRNDQEKAS